MSVVWWSPKNKSTTLKPVWTFPNYFQFNQLISSPCHLKDSCFLIWCCSQNSIHITDPSFKVLADSLCKNGKKDLWNVLSITNIKTRNTLSPPCNATGKQLRCHGRPWLFEFSGNSVWQSLLRILRVAGFRSPFLLSWRRVRESIWLFVRKASHTRSHAFSIQRRLAWAHLHFGTALYEARHFTTVKLGKS